MSSSRECVVGVRQSERVANSRRPEKVWTREQRTSLLFADLQDRPGVYGSDGSDGLNVPLLECRSHHSRWPCASAADGSVLNLDALKAAFRTPGSLPPAEMLNIFGFRVAAIESMSANSVPKPQAPRTVARSCPSNLDLERSHSCRTLLPRVGQGIGSSVRLRIVIV